MEHDTPGRSGVRQGVPWSSILHAGMARRQPYPQSQGARVDWCAGRVVEALRTYGKATQQLRWKSWPMVVPATIVIVAELG